jgi:hypothetical protein
MICDNDMIYDKIVIWYDIRCYDTIIRYDMIYYTIMIYMIWYMMIWYDMIYDMIYDIWYDIWYNIRYDIFVNLIGLTTGGSSTKPGVGSVSSNRRLC